MHAFKAGEQWWPDRAFEREFIQPEQDARYEADAWEQLVAAYLAGKERVTVMGVAREALSIEVPKLGTAEQRRISGVLEHLGWVRGERSNGIRWYVRGARQ